jgi:hypothetical protein
MAQVWVNGRFFTSEQTKAQDWTPPSQPDKTLWRLCPDCGCSIYQLESCWPMADKTVCVWNGCWEKYHQQGLGYHGCAGLDLGVALEG